MSQVDYVHYFNNVLWTVVQLLIVYIMICIFYVQVFYKVVRLRKLVSSYFLIVVKKQILGWKLLVSLLLLSNVTIRNKMTTNIMLVKKNLIKKIKKLCI